MTEKKRTMTIKDIALHTGLSKGTVDRVLHNRGEVSKKSYEKVMRYIEESGYTPNVHASLLASRMDRQIAVLLPHHEPGSFWELAQKGLSEAEESVTGLGLLVRRVGYEQFDVDSFNKACEEILGSDPDGVVIAPMFRSQTAVLTERLRQKGIPYVYIDSKLEEDDYMPVEFDNTYGWTYDYDRFIDPAYPDREGYTIKFLVDIYNGTEEDGRFFYRTITHRQVIDQEGNIVEDTILNPGEPGKYAMDTYYEHP